MINTEARLEAIFKECVRHLKRLNYAYNELGPSIPFTAAKVNKLNDKQI